MEKVAIVILNYLNYKDTIECIESLNYDIYPEKNVIIVDNGSKNESWKELNKLYKDKKDIYLLRNEENLGFAKGNNLGIDFARKNLKCKFVLLVNNDTIFKDPTLITKLMESYKEGIGVIGPNIISADNYQQNPIAKAFTQEEFQKELKKLGKIKRRIKTSDIWIKIRKNKLLNEIMEKRKKVKKNKIINNELAKLEVCSKELVLHGACMLLTKDYFDYYPYLYPKTFLYYEENILTLITKKVNLNKKYIPNVYIYHKEDQSSKMSFNNLGNIRERYVYASAKEYHKLLDLSYEEILKEFK